MSTTTTPRTLATVCGGCGHTYGWHDKDADRCVATLDTATAHCGCVGFVDPPAGRTKLGGLRITAQESHYTSTRVGELTVQRHTGDITVLRVRGLSVSGYIYPLDQLTDDHRLLLVDDLSGDPIVDVRIPVSTLGIELIAEGMLRGYATANGVDVPTTGPVPDPARWENGDWKTCSLHGGAITQDCLCDPATGLGDVDAAAWALYLASCRRAAVTPLDHSGQLTYRAHQDLLAYARAALEAYHGIKARPADAEQEA